MNSVWTAEQVLALAPDPAAAKAGQGLTGLSKWPTLGANAATVWGECQGSGSKPYQVQIDLNGPAFHCTCPSRKFPCKHGIGLFLIYVNSPAATPAAAPPPWVASWMAKRNEKAAEKELKAAQPAPEKSADEVARNAQQSAKRAEQREQKVAQGLEDLDLWLCDLVRQGLASAASRPYRFWDERASRLVDAQAPGAARRVRELATFAASGGQTQERLLERLALLHLLVNAYRRIDSLPNALRADLRDAIGFTVRQEAVLAGDGVRDRWMVAGRHSYDEDQIRVHRTWLQGAGTRRNALLLQFSRVGVPAEAMLPVGLAIDAELAFYDGTYPLRAVIKERAQEMAPVTQVHGYPSIDAMMGVYATAIAANPWLEVFPMMLLGATATRAGQRFVVIDSAGRTLPTALEARREWELLALSGGRPAPIFGEWDGETFRPLKVWL